MPSVLYCFKCQEIILEIKDNMLPFIRPGICFVCHTPLRLMPKCPRCHALDRIDVIHSKDKDEYFCDHCGIQLAIIQYKSEGLE